MWGSMNETIAVVYSHDVMEKLEKWLLPSVAGIHMYMHIPVAVCVVWMEVSASV